MVDPLGYFSQSSTTSVAKAVVRVILSVMHMMHIKEPVQLIERIAHVVAAGFLSHYLSGSLPYV